MSENPHLERLDHRDFKELALDELARRTGLDAPSDPTPDEERAWREKAWRSYKLELENRGEWGTATQSTRVPGGEAPD